jgi:hypothetical protein
MGFYSQTILQDSPIAYWRLAELSGTSAADSSGNSRTGTYHSCTLSLAGAIAADNNPAASFDGTSSYVDCPSLAPGAHFSVEAWGYKTASGTAAIAAQGTAAVDQETFYFRLGSGSGFTTAASTYQEITLADVSLNAWHHHVLTYDGSTLRYYLDGVLTTSGAASGTPQTLSNHCIIARMGDFSAQYWPGKLDEVAVYSAALSAARIAAHYQAGTAAGMLAGPVVR